MDLASYTAVLKHIFLKLCRAGIQSKLTQKKHLKKQQFEAKNKGKSD